MLNYYPIPRGVITVKIAIKTVIVLLGSVLLLALTLVVLQTAASERVEVVELHTVDELGEPVTTRLWVVDDEGYQYLRVGSDGSGWFDRLRRNEEFELTRSGRRQSYRSVLRTDKSERISDLMQAKYTWGDSVIGFLVGSREGSVPIELHRL
jgi:hypothetical protein